MNRFISILFLFTLGACHQEAGKGNYRIIKEEDFDVISIASEKHYFTEIINPSNIGLIDGKVLVSEAWRVPQEHPRIHIIDSKDWTYDKPKGKHGEGPLEVTDAGLFFKGNNPDEGLFIRVGLRRDRLEIFNNRDKSFIIIDGPDLELPAFDLIEVSGMARLNFGPDPLIHYKDAVVTEKYLFALYAGVSYFDFTKTAVLAEQIWVFDHKGNPLGS